MANAIGGREAFADPTECGGPPTPIKRANVRLTDIQLFTAGFGSAVQSHHQIVLNMADTVPRMVRTVALMVNRVMT